MVKISHEKCSLFKSSLIISARFNLEKNLEQIGSTLYTSIFLKGQNGGGPIRTAQ